MDEKMKLLEEFGIDQGSLDYSIDDFTVEELREKFEAAAARATADSNDTRDAGAENAGGESEDQFALTSNILDEVINALSAVTVQREWGECPRYSYADCDLEANEVYCWDRNDWLLYGFKYEMNGDNVVIDFNSKTRKKYEIVDFDEGEQASPFMTVYEEMEQRLSNTAELEEKYRNASDTIASMETELGELRQFKTDTEFAIAQSKREEIFAKFGDLAGVEAFEQLKEQNENYDLETLEEKCFAIRGRNGTPVNFGLENKTPKIKIGIAENIDEPYGGIMQKYGCTSEE